MIRNIKDLTDNQLKEIRTLEGVTFFNNFKSLIDISTKADNLPKGNSFALIQKDYGIVETHAMQHEDTFENAWQVLYPFYKKAYLNKDVSSKYFRDIDSHMYQYNSKQIFNLLRIENIPLLDSELSKKLRTELGWK